MPARQSHCACMRDTYVFASIGPLLWRGLRGRISSDDLPQLPPGYESAELTLAAQETFACCRKNGKATPNALVIALLGVMGRGTIAMACLLAFIADVCGAVIPASLAHTADTKTVKNALWVVFLLIVRALASNSFFYRTDMAGLRMCIAIRGMVHDKAQRLSSDARSRWPPAKILNLTSTGASRMQNSFWHIVDASHAVVSLILSASALCYIIGPAGLAALAALAMIAPLIALASKKQSEYGNMATAAAERRVALVQDAVSGMRVVKTHAWEDAFLARITAIRAEEVRALQKGRMASVILSVLGASAGVVATALTFVAAAAFGRELSTAVIVTVIAQCAAMASAFQCIPGASVHISQGMTAMRKVCALLDERDINLAQMTLCAQTATKLNTDQQTTSNPVERLSSVRTPGAPMYSRTDRSANGCDEPTEHSTASSTYFVQIQASDSNAILDDDCVAIPIGTDSDAAGDNGNLTAKSCDINERNSRDSGSVPYNFIQAHTQGNASMADSADIVQMQPVPGSVVKPSIGKLGTSDAHVHKPTTNPILHRAEFAAGKVSSGSMSELESVAVSGDITGVQVNHGTFSWLALGPPVLEDVSLSIAPGALVAIVGSVGSGKSTLLSSILGETLCRAGTVMRAANVSYCAQEPWLANASVRENILFGADFHAARYAAVVEACALERDFAALPGGDLTMIGTGGGALSGGQRARVALARAAYAQAPLVLLDDPLAALDVHVSAHVFRSCVRTLMSGSTRLFVTQRHSMLLHADWVVVIDGGRIAAQGTYASLLASGVHFANEHVPTPSPQTQQLAVVKSPSMVSSASVPVLPKLTEEPAVGTYAALLSYVSTSGGPLLFAFAAIAFLCRSVIRAISSNDVASEGASLHERVQFFSLQQAAYVALSCLADVLVAIAAQRAACAIHDAALRGVFRAPMIFFDHTSAGTVAERLGRDVDVVDDLVGPVLGSVISSVMSISVPLFFLTRHLHGASRLLYLLLAWLLGVYVLVSWAYCACSEVARKAQSDSRGPYAAGFTESLIGAATIRAFSAGGVFSSRVSAAQDCGTRAIHALQRMQRFLYIVLASSNAMAIGVLCAAPDAATAIVIVNVFVALNRVSYCIRRISDLAVNLQSVARLQFYAEGLGTESARHTKYDASLGAWPAPGGIAFSNVVMRYADGLPAALDGLTLSVAAGETLGIVGRTGAGKSSLVHALLRLVELESGSIHVGKRDVARIGLCALRSRISVIPQQPVLFSGTVRFNLDPTGKASKAALCSALKAARMATIVDALPGGLDEQVSAAAFSAGQRQMLCLARAVLQGSCVVVLDEATAAVDTETDIAMREVVRTAFPRATVIVVAHRLETVMECDRVAVLDAGRVKEVGRPLSLAADQSSCFYQLIRGNH